MDPQAWGLHTVLIHGVVKEGHTHTHTLCIAVKTCIWFKVSRWESCVYGKRPLSFWLAVL